MAKVQIKIELQKDKLPKQYYFLYYQIKKRIKRANTLLEICVKEIIDMKQYPYNDTTDLVVYDNEQKEKKTE